jgi:hypothetical protein
MDPMTAGLFTLMLNLINTCPLCASFNPKIKKWMACRNLCERLDSPTKDGNSFYADEILPQVRIGAMVRLFC